jgi:DNA modification methylase
MKPYYEDTKAGIVIYHGDCREILPALPKVDLVLTDPPYGIKAASPKRGGRQDGLSLCPSREYGKTSWDDKRIEWILEVLSGTNNVVWGDPEEWPDDLRVREFPNLQPA